MPLSSRGRKWWLRADKKTHWQECAMSCHIRLDYCTRLVFCSQTSAFARLLGLKKIPTKFSYYLIPRIGFEPMSVVSQQSCTRLEPFEERSTNWAIAPRRIRLVEKLISSVPTANYPTATTFSCPIVVTSASFRPSLWRIRNQLFRAEVGQFPPDVESHRGVHLVELDGSEFGYVLTQPNYYPRNL